MHHHSHTTLYSSSELTFSFITILILLLFSDRCYCKLEIHHMSVPKYIENGTEDSVILDCVYTLDEIEDKNLVVKWFLNDDPEPIYQWIPELSNRHASSRLRGRINMDYSVDSSNPLIKYRALNLLRPTVDLSGRYSCHVMSLKSQDSAEDTMTVFAKPKSFEFNSKVITISKNSAALRTKKGQKSQKGLKLTSESSFTNSRDDGRYSSISMLTCQVTEVHPLPEMTIYSMGHDGTNPQTLDVIENDVHQTNNGAYNINITCFINDNDMMEKFGNGPSIFECLLMLPEIKYETRKRITYFPAEALTSGNGRDGTYFLLTMFCTVISALILNLDEVN